MSARIGNPKKRELRTLSRRDLSGIVLKNAARPAEICRTLDGAVFRFGSGDETDAILAATLMMDSDAGRRSRWLHKIVNEFDFLRPSPISRTVNAGSVFGAILSFGDGDEAGVSGSIEARSMLSRMGAVIYAFMRKNPSEFAELRPDIEKMFAGTLHERVGADMLRELKKNSGGSEIPTDRNGRPEWYDAVASGYSSFHNHWHGGSVVDYLLCSTPAVYEMEGFVEHARSSPEWPVLCECALAGNTPPGASVDMDLMFGTCGLAALDDLLLGSKHFGLKKPWSAAAIEMLVSDGRTPNSFMLSGDAFATDRTGKRMAMTPPDYSPLLVKLLEKKRNLGVLDEFMRERGFGIVASETVPFRDSFLGRRMFLRPESIKKNGVEEYDRFKKMRKILSEDSSFLDASPERTALRIMTDVGFFPGTEDALDEDGLPRREWGEAAFRSLTAVCSDIPVGEKERTAREKALAVLSSNPELLGLPASGETFREEPSSDMLARFMCLWTNLDEHGRSKIGHVAAAFIESFNGGEVSEAGAATFARRLVAADNERFEAAKAEFIRISGLEKQSVWKAVPLITGEDEQATGELAAMLFRFAEAAVAGRAPDENIFGRESSSGDMFVM